MTTKSSAIQKISIIVALVCYILTIYSFFTQESIIVLVFFVLHSIALFFVAYLSVNDRADYSEYQSMDTKITELTAECEHLRSELAQKIQAKEDEINILNIEMNKYKTAADDERERADRIFNRLGEMEKEAEEVAAKGILPWSDDSLDKKEKLDIVALARDVVNEMAEYAQDAALVVSISSTEDSLDVLGHRGMLRTLFRNIVDNSIKYAKRAGNLVITLSTIGDDIFVVLKDNGEGLDPVETGHIFELNYQGSNRISGNGLGLAQAKAIVDYYGGNIYAKSMEGSGMGIYIQLPACERRGD